MSEKINLPSHDFCTGCMACVAGCPRHAISISKNEYGEEFPEIDEVQCVQCGKCLKACHLNKSFFPDKRSENVYAAWSTDSNIRQKSASGGIAATLYRFALQNKFHAFGVKLNENHEAVYFELTCQEDIEVCQNSKYVFSQMRDTYRRVETYLKAGEKVLYVGLPCHIAGVRSYLGKDYESLILVDLVCHGTCSAQFLKEHVHCIEERKKQKINAISFRDPQYGTNSFIFTLRNQEKIIYAVPVDYIDAYQIGYHRALIYRENCYHCRYARAERISDLTISDFSGLGRLQEWDKERKSVSCVITSTEKGRMLLGSLVKEGKIESYRRPSDEAYQYEKQLRGPSVPNVHRKEFLQRYFEGAGFDQAVQQVCKREIRRNFVAHTLRIKEMIVMLRKIMPKKVKATIKKELKHFQKTGEKTYEKDKQFINK